MSDFKSQAEVWQWLIEDQTRRIVGIHLGLELGFKDGFLWNFTESQISVHSFLNPPSWKKVKPKVKYLKSIRQILNEYPDAQWGADGCLKHTDWRGFITSRMFKSFGGRLSEAKKDQYYCDEWIEEREVGQ